MAEPITLTISNDYELIVRGLHGMLRNYRSKVNVVEMDSSGGDDVGDQMTDVALVDTFGHAQGDGDAVADLVESQTAHHVVVYSWNTDEALIRRTLALGVHGYLGKGLPAGTLVDSLLRVVDGEIVVETGTPYPTQTPGDWPGREEGLAPREAEMIALITQGLTNDEIAAQTQLSPNTIKSYIRAAYRKIGVGSRPHAVLWGVEHGMRPTDSIPVAAGRR